MSVYTNIGLLYVVLCNPLTDALCYFIRQKLVFLLTLWRLLLPYGYSYKASHARPG